jgi:hypothetical protein
VPAVQTSLMQVLGQLSNRGPIGTVYSCKEEADVDDNNSVNVVDLTKLLAFPFSGGVIGVCRKNLSREVPHKRMKAAPKGAAFSMRAFPRCPNSVYCVTSTYPM